MEEYKEEFFDDLDYAIENASERVKLLTKDQNMTIEIVGKWFAEYIKLR